MTFISIVVACAVGTDVVVVCSVTGVIPAPSVNGGWFRSGTITLSRIVCFVISYALVWADVVIDLVLSSISYGLHRTSYYIYQFMRGVT